MGPEIKKTTIRDVEKLPPLSGDQFKLIFEHTKHLTTLSAGSIVVIVTLYDKLASPRHWKVFVALSLICFVASIITGLYAQIRIVDAFGGDIEEDKDTKVSMFASWIGFALGMLTLCAYGIRNFY